MYIVTQKKDRVKECLLKKIKNFQEKRENNSDLGNWSNQIKLYDSFLDKKGSEKKIKVTGRHDPCVGVRATPIAEAMTALVIIDHYLRNRAQNADVISEVPDF